MMAGECEDCEVRGERSKRQRRQRRIIKESHNLEDAGPAQGRRHYGHVQQPSGKGGAGLNEVTDNASQTNRKLYSILFLGVIRSHRIYYSTCQEKILGQYMVHGVIYTRSKIMISHHALEVEYGIRHGEASCRTAIRMPVDARSRAFNVVWVSKHCQSFG